MMMLSIFLSGSILIVCPAAVCKWKSLKEEKLKFLNKEFKPSELDTIAEIMADLWLLFCVIMFVLINI